MKDRGRTIMVHTVGDFLKSSIGTVVPIEGRLSSGISDGRDDGEKSSRTVQYELQSSPIQSN